MKHTDQAVATARRNSQIEANHYADIARKARSQQPKLATLLQLLAAGATLADMLALKAKVDFDNSGSLNINDYGAFGNAYQTAATWEQQMKAPSNLQAAVAGANVTLTWANNATDPAASTRILRNGTEVGIVAPGTALYTDTPGNGTWSYQTQAFTTLYPSPLSNTATATVGVITPPVSGWTDLAPAPGAAVIYASSSMGADSNPGTQAAPVRTLSRGYQLLRDSHPDQLLLKCGDTFDPIGWTKASGDPAHPMICASYGTGPRPAIRGGGFFLGQQNKSGLAFVDLDIQPSGGVGSASNGFVMFAPWRDVLFEGCYVGGFNVDIAVQEVTADRLSNVKFRRCVIVDGAGGGGHNQGLFVGSCDGLLVEECVFDLNGNYPGLEKADMFCHNVYLHQTNGPSTFINNVTARACSHGVQQRSGGVMSGNLALDNPIGLFQGDASGVHNTFTYNGAVGSRDISAAELRGFGLWVNGSAGIDILYNFAAHQRSGSANCVALELDGVVVAIVRGNAIVDWPCPPHEDWGHGIEGGGIAVLEDNRIYQTSGGECIFGSTGGTRRNNHYWSTSTNCFNGGTWAAYQTSENGSVFAAPSAPLDVSVGTYMSSIGLAGGVPEFMARARANCKQNWDVRFTAKAFNDWARNRLGIPNPA